MWVTTKTIVKEIRKEQASLVDRVAEVESTIQKYNLSICEHFSELNQKISNITQKNDLFQNRYEEDQSFLISRFHEIIESVVKSENNTSFLISDGILKMETTYKELLKQERDDLSDIISENMKSLIKQITQELETNRNTTNKESSEIVGLVKSYYSNLTEEIVTASQQTREAINEHVQEIKSEVDESVKKSNAKTIIDVMKMQNELNQSIKEIESKENIITDNINLVNHSLQEIMGYLLSLDEGNRLVIAKLLLKDMEI